MTEYLDEDGDREDVPFPGGEIADQERSYWDNRRLMQELDDDEAGRRERRRLRMQERKTHLEVRIHRSARQQGQGPMPRNQVLPPRPDHDDFYGHDIMGSHDEPG